jgi:ADP-ribosylglycohydrolase
VVLVENFRERKFTMDASPTARLKRARSSLEGLSVGDAFGQGFFMSFEWAAHLMASEEFGKPPYDFQDEFVLREFVRRRRTDHIDKPWRWTDDTALAIEVFDNLREFDEIDPDTLARAFSNRYFSDPTRGYGGAMHSLLPELGFGNWEQCAGALFGGTGSFGNGAAMRSAPIGAYFADSPALAASYATLASQVTHSHSEGIAGGVAVAMAACFAAQGCEGDKLIAEVLPFLSEGVVKTGLEKAQTMASASVEEAAEVLGVGDLVSAQDTVPFCLWCGSRNLNDFEAALWETVAGLGDRDTTCAIVGGIVASRTGTSGIPSGWLQNRESLDLK